MYNLCPATINRDIITIPSHTSLEISPYHQQTSLLLSANKCSLFFSYKHLCSVSKSFTADSGLLSSLTLAQTAVLYNKGLLAGVRGQPKPYVHPSVCCATDSGDEGDGGEG